LERERELARLYELVAEAADGRFEFAAVEARGGRGSQRC
jgi:hypothetical protein